MPCRMVPLACLALVHSAQPPVAKLIMCKDTKFFHNKDLYACFSRLSRAFCPSAGCMCHEICANDMAHACEMIARYLITPLI